MKIIASNINNLTDARYFASWGVDVLCYDFGMTESLQLDRIKEIKNWLEGSISALKIDGLQVPKGFGEVIEELEIKHLLIGPFIEKSGLPETIDNIHRICSLIDGSYDNEKLILLIDTALSKLTEEKMEKIKKLATDKEVYLDGVFTETDIPILSQLGIEGIVLKGGEEDITGVKSFDHLDPILEALYEK